MTGRIIKLGNVLVDGEKMSAYQTENKTVKWFDVNSVVHIAEPVIASSFVGHDPTVKGRKRK